MAAPPFEKHPVHQLSSFKNSGQNMYDHSIIIGNENNSNQNPAFGNGGGLIYNQGGGGHVKTGTKNPYGELGMILPRNQVNRRAPSQMPHRKAASFEELGLNLPPRNQVQRRAPLQVSKEGAVLQTDSRSLLKTSNNLNCLNEKNSNVNGYHKPNVDFIDLTAEENVIPELVESNFIDLTVEKDSPVENEITQLTRVDNPIPDHTRPSPVLMGCHPSLVDTQSDLVQSDECNQTNKQSLDAEHNRPTSEIIGMDIHSDLVQSLEYNPMPKNKKHSLDFDDTQPPPPKRIRRDYQSGLVDRPKELVQEHVQGPVCNGNHLVPSGELNNKSDLVQEGKENLVEEASTTVIRNGVGNPVSLIDSFTANQIKQHLSSLSQSTSQNICRTGVQKTERSDCNTCQLCPMDTATFKPSPVFCACCGSCVKPHVKFYWTSDDMDRKICFCGRCYRGSRSNNIAYQGLFMAKSNLQKGINETETDEPWVQCDDCGRWQHQICALYNTLADTNGKEKYFCPYCILNKRVLGDPLPVAFGAKDLPSTPLSDHIEQRLFRQLNKDREERAKKFEKSVNEVPKAEDLVVRVVLSSQKQLKVSKEFRGVIPHKQYPQEFLYQSKMIMLFQKIEGVDVCLFAMYVQEYGSECPPPNQRSVYISYLDSIKYFKPEIKAATGEALRTYVYQEIMIGYLDYCKKQGFVTCYIWACPPAKCDDYILYCHPKSQKIPSVEKLRHWYKAMLKKSMKEGIVVDMTNMLSQFFCNDKGTKITAAQLPYFDGDFWTKAAENYIKEIENVRGPEGTATTRMARSMGYNDITDDNRMDILVMQKLADTFHHFAGDFMVVHLHDTCKTCHNAIAGNYWSCPQCKKTDICSRCIPNNGNPKERKTHTNADGEKHTLVQLTKNYLPADTGRGEAKLDNDLFGNRHYLLSFCQENHYQFDTLRRAKHSSMMMLYKLKSQQQQQKMSQQVMLEVLIHASRCSAKSGCSSIPCLRLKKLFHHASTCSIKRVGGCVYCVRLWMLLNNHSRRCKDASCRVPRCE